MLKNSLLCLLVIITIAYGSMFGLQGAWAEDDNKGWATLTGVLVWVDQSYSSSSRQKQLVLIDDNKREIILIGEAVNKLLDKIGKQVTVTGVYKPSMAIKGADTAVLEVRFIDRIYENSEKNAKKP